MQTRVTPVYELFTCGERARTQQSAEPAVVLGGRGQVGGTSQRISFVCYAHGDGLLGLPYLSGVVLPFYSNRDRSFGDWRKALRAFTHPAERDEAVLPYPTLTAAYPLPPVSIVQGGVMELGWCGRGGCFDGWRTAAVNDYEVEQGHLDDEAWDELDEWFGADVRVYLLWPDLPGWHEPEACA